MRKARIIFSYFPLFLIGIYISFIYRVVNKLGVFPKPYISPDPKELGFDLHHDAIWFFSMILAPPVITGWFVLGIRYKITKVNSMIFIISIMVIILLYSLFPDVVDWFMD